MAWSEIYLRTVGDKTNYLVSSPAGSYFTFLNFEEKKKF